MKLTGRCTPLVLLALVACGCSQELPEPGMLTVAIAASPNNLDPRFGTDSYSARAQQLLYTDLLRLDDNSRLAPGLAESWETDDYKTYRLHLRPGVRFHDGHELTSKDVLYTFNTILDSRNASPLRGAYRQVDSITAVDPYTIEFVLKEPSGAFLINLVVRIVPDGAGRELRDHPIGTGPYEFVSFSADDRLVVKAFPEYFEGRARNNGVTLKVIPDDIMRGLELRKRTSQLVVNDLVPDIAYQLEKEGLHLDQATGMNYQYLGFNLRDPILQDVRVRHAIGYAIDRQSIVEYLRRGLAVQAVGMLSPTNWAFEPDVFDFTYDPDTARRLLDQAGYPDPDGDGPRPRLSLTLKVSSATEFNRLQSAVIQQNLREVGIELDVRTYEFATLYADIIKGNFQMYTLQWAGGATADPDILRRVFHSQQVPPAGFNRGHLSDPALDQLIEAASLATSLEDRKLRYGKVQKRVAELAPYISLWIETNIALSQPELRGVHLTPQTDFTFLRNVSR
ncbi:MAG: ABC transporter substrate-binding protein [Vicinamibacterales bacterium]|nr:ABC transporter substrate-binding protein [Vicinamibacterales bacterium]